jgi:hypothetical protein
MNKFILSAVAAGALAVGGAASAQDLGGVIGSIFGYGNQQYPSYSTSTPAVVAGTQGYYGNNVYGNNAYGGNVYGNNGTVYVDQYGRQITYDRYGRQVIVQQQPSTSTYGVMGYDQWGRPIYGTTTDGATTYGTYGSGERYGYGDRYANRSWDRDGDGVPNAQDRWPDDPRYQ